MPLNWEHPQPGNCGTTTFDHSKSCEGTSAQRGSWRIWGADDCIARCASCKQCNFVSVGTDGDCSWYQSCNTLHSTDGGPGAPELRSETYRVRDKRGLLSSNHIGSGLMWIEQCAKAFSLHPMRWNNCAVSANDRVRPQLARTLLKTFRRRSSTGAPLRLVLVGDSVVRDMFTLLACLLVPEMRLPPRTMHGVDVGRNAEGPVQLELLSSNSSISFVWFWEGEHSQPMTAATRATTQRILSEATAIVFSAGAHFREPKSMREALSRAASTLFGDSDAGLQRGFAVAEYTAPHFPASLDGEYIEKLHMHNRELRHCDALDNNSSALTSPWTSWRRDVLDEFARMHDLPVIRMWHKTVTSHDDHPPPSLGDYGAYFRSIDCRHWCNPGRTSYKLVGAIASWIDGRHGTFQPIMNNDQNLLFAAQHSRRRL